MHTPSPEIRKIQAIDVHAHYGPFVRLELPLNSRLVSQGPAKVVELARLAGTELTIASSSLALTPRGQADAAAGNDDAMREVTRTQGLAFWVVVHPLQPRTYDQARDMLQHPKCMGIKLHPEEHCYPITEHGRKLLGFAAEQQAVVLTHTGESLSRPADFAVLADDFPELPLILAHLGNSQVGELFWQVEALQRSKSRGLYIDTSSMNSMINGLIEWGVSQVGAERLLYGTDSPLYFAPCQRVRIDLADITDQEKRLILRENALRLFGAERIAAAIPAGELVHR